MSHINPQTDAAREAARRSNGEFGPQQRTESAVSLDPHQIARDKVSQAVLRDFNRNPSDRVQAGFDAAMSINQARVVLDGQLTDDEASLAAALCRHDGVRDTALFTLQHGRGPTDMHELDDAAVGSAAPHRDQLGRCIDDLMCLERKVHPDHRAGVAAALAHSHWLAGDFRTASASAARALDDDPDHALADLVDRLCAANLPPAYRSS